VNVPNDLDIPMPHMTPAEASYRARRPRARLDGETRRMVMLAGGIGAVLLVLVGIWAVAGGHHGGGVPVVLADTKPWRTKPDVQPTLPDGADDATANATDTLAPPPEVPAPQTLKNEADKLNATAAPQIAIVAPTAAPPTTASPTVAPLADLPVAAPTEPPAASRSTVAPARALGTAQIQLGALDSEQAAMTEWQRLQHKLPDLLGARQPAIARAEHDGKTFYRLRTGGFATIATATAFCEQVRQKGTVCTLAHS